MFDPHQAAHEAGTYAREHPAQTGAGLIAIGLILKAVTLIKLLAWGLLTLGMVFLWEAFRKDTENNTNN